MATSYLPASYRIPPCYAGDTFPGLTVSGITVDGSAPTVALASVRMHFRTAPDASTAALELSSSSGITITDASAYAFTVDSFLITLAADTYYWDIECTDSGGTVRTYLAGHWVVHQDISRS